MSQNTIVSGCACCSFSRRQILAAGCAACAGAGGVLATAARAAEAASKDDKVRIRVIYVAHAVKTPSPDWPHVGYDFAPVMQSVTGELKKALPNFEFTTCMANGPEATAKFLEEDKNGRIDGYLVYQLNLWNQVVQSVAASGKPTLFADFAYGGSGGLLVFTAGLLRAKAANLGFVSSPRMEDLVAAVKCFEIVKKGGTPAEFAAATARIRRERTPKTGDLACKPDKCDTVSPKDCLARMKEAKILAVEQGWPGIDEAIRKEMGFEVASMKFAELNAAWEAADKDEAQAVAERWKKSAAKVAGVSDETLRTSAAMYIGMKGLLAKHNANAITINCLGGFYGKHIHAYPCLGFQELLNDGMIGACECDVRSTATMVAMNALTQGRPGFISDPIIDTSKRQIVYAHCVASNKPFGPKGASNPFEILTHSEDRNGASVRSLLPAGYMTTSVEFAPERKQILFHRGKAVGNVDDDRACRTKLAAEPVGDIEKLFTEWDQWGWHRVTVYGDLKEPVFALADAMGWKVVEEA